MIIARKQWRVQLATNATARELPYLAAVIATSERSDPMTERSYQDAVQVLKDRLGARWEGLETEGRDEMVSILKQQLGFDNRAANDAIDEMIQSGTLRYHRDVAGDVERAAESDVERTADGILPVAPVAAGVPSGGGGLGAVPLAGTIANPGHWQIGPGEGGESEIIGRKGQVTPR
jgi:hypothetical protein